MLRRHNAITLGSTRFFVCAGILVGAFIVGQPDAANAQKIDHVHSKLQSNGRFQSDHDVWPPQPKAIVDTRIFPPAISKASYAATSFAMALPDRDASVAAALGERFTFVSTELLARKGNRADTRSKLTYFSHSKNRTVEVVADGEVILSTRAIEPSVYQPPLTPDEVQEAITIARQHWASVDDGRVLGHDGFAILGFQDSGASGFYDIRAAYVTFHQGVDGRPEYIAWVDLTNGAVFKSWEE